MQCRAAKAKRLHIHCFILSYSHTKELLSLPIKKICSERVSRLGKEIVGLMSDLPLNPSSSVFVRVDEDRVRVLN